MLFKTYMKKFELKQLNIYDKTLLYECKNSLKSFEYDFDLMPINHQENILISILDRV